MEQKLPIGVEELRNALETLRVYRRGKQNLDRRIVDGEQWWKLRHWDRMNPQHGAPGDPKPASGWLVNVCLSKHADAMDAYPEALCLPREPADRRQAAALSDILPVVLEQNDYEKVYDACWWYKIKHGASCKGIFWDPSRLGGLGDIAIRRVDLLNLFWEPGITDIQQSRNVFSVELRDDDLLEAEYPFLRGKLGGRNMGTVRYLYDDQVDTTGKSLVVDWYYKKRQGGKTVLHYCKFVDEFLLFSSENEAAAARFDGSGQKSMASGRLTSNLPYEEACVGDDACIVPKAFGDDGQKSMTSGRMQASSPTGGYRDGWYKHGKYPFVFDVLFPMEGTPAGFGYIALCRDAQEQIDLMNNAILKNTLAAATPRWFIRNDGAVNEEEYLDLTQPFIHTNATLGQDSILPVNVQGLSDVYVACLNNKIGELKEVSGNRDVANGGTTAGVTAASAIAAMQEQAGKLSRDQIQASYRAFREEILLIIELMREFYDAPRQFRITGGQFVSFDNSGLLPQSQGVEFGVDLGMRTPLFDVKVTAQRQSPYAKAVYNELGIQLYQLGFFNPQMADQALTCLQIMDFEGKEELMAGIARNAGRWQAEQVRMRSREVTLPASDRLGNLEEKEAKIVEKARKRAREVAQPR